MTCFRVARFDVQHPFDEIDLLDIGESVKHMNIVVVAQAFLFKMKGRVSRARDPVLAQVSPFLKLFSFFKQKKNRVNSTIFVLL